MLYRRRNKKLKNRIKDGREKEGKIRTENRKFEKMIIIKRMEEENCVDWGYSVAGRVGKVPNRGGPMVYI